MNRAFSKILILVIFVVLASGGFFSWQYFGAPKEEPKASEEGLIEDETADWQTYRNEEYGYEVKYPKDFIIEVNSSGPLFLSPEDVLSRQVQDPHFHTFSLFIQPLEVKWGDTLKQAVKERFALNEFKEQEPSGSSRTGDVDWIRKIFIGDNIEAYFVREWIQSFTQCHYLNKKDNVLIDMSRDARNGCLDNTTLNQMLSTFKF